MAWDFGYAYPADQDGGSDTYATVKPVMMLRIHYRDVYDGDTHPGTHYHYEVVIGASANNSIARFLNARLSSKFGPEFFEARQRHNVIEVGTFENYLPVLFAQRDDLSHLGFSRARDPARQGTRQGHDRSLFETRAAGFAAASDPYEFQACDKPSFL